MATLVGTNAADSLLGGDSADVLFGGAGADTLRGGGAEDTLSGGGGDDVIEGGLGADRLSGGGGNDVFRFAGLGDLDGDYIGDARPGDRLEFGFAGGAPGWAFIGAAEFSGAGQEIRAVNMALSDGNQRLRIEFGPESLTLAGNLFLAQRAPGVFDILLNRTIAGTAGADTRVGAGGADTLRGLGGNDLLLGDAAGNLMFGDAGADTLRGEAGADRLDGGDGNDLLFGGAGHDRLFGAAGADTLLGDAGSDVLDGGPGDDLLFGGADADTLSGGERADTLIGGGGGDALRGGAGNDLFVLGGVLDFGLLGGGGGGGASIGDFSPGDLIDLSALRGFRFITDAQFSGEAGEIRFDGVSILVDSDGDALADRGLGMGLAAWGLEETAPGTLLLQVAPGRTLSGTAGADTLVGGGGRDTLSGVAGNDVLRGGGGNDDVSGGDGADLLHGDGGRNSLSGGRGRDVLVGTALDSMHGDEGADRFVFTSLGDRFFPNPFNVFDLQRDDLIDLAGFAGLRFIGAADFGFLPGEVRVDAGSFLILIDLDGDAQADRGIGISLGGDVGSNPLLLEETGPGTMVLRLAAPTIVGTAGNDRVAGGLDSGHAEILRGLAGEDTLRAVGSDSLAGGAGNDLFVLGSGALRGATVLDLAAGDTLGISFFRNLGAVGEALPITYIDDPAAPATIGEVRLVRDVWIDGHYLLTALVASETHYYPATVFNLAGFNGTLAGPAGTTFELTLHAEGPAHGVLIGSAAADTLTATEAGDTERGFDGTDILRGGGGADLLDGGRDDDQLFGGRGNDTLIGGVGADTLTGGTGPDLFIFLGSHSRRGARHDVITDFDGAAGDTIDLAAIDADTDLEGNQSFTFIGGDAFTGLGQLRYAGGLLQANLAWDSAAELEIELSGAPEMAAGWVLL